MDRFQATFQNLYYLAVTHLVSNTYGPRTFGPQLIGPFWTNGPQPIQSSWTNGPQKFGPSGQMVPRTFFLSRGTGCGDPEIRGPNWLGTICLGLPNVWGPFVYGDRISWGSFVKGDRKWGTGSPGIKWVRDQMRRSRHLYNVEVFIETKHSDITTVYHNRKERLWSPLEN